MRNFKMMAFALVLCAPVSIVAETTPVKNSSTGQSNQRNVLVQLYKNVSKKVMRMPGLPIYVECWVDGESFRVEAPENIYIDSASLELMTSPWGYWPSIAGDGTGCTIEFDGIPGEYKLVLMENEVEYVGYFTLE